MKSDECSGNIYSYCKGPQDKRVCHGIFFTDATKSAYTFHKKLIKGVSIKATCEEISERLFRETISTVAPTELPDTNSTTITPEVVAHTTETPTESAEPSITTARPEVFVETTL